MKGKTFLKVLGLILLTAGLGVLLGFVQKKQSRLICESVEVHIPGEKFLITAGEVEQLLTAAEPAILNQPVSHARLRDMEELIRESPYVKEVSVYAGVNGVLKVELSQREPVVRIINDANKHFYLDATGHKMPLSPNYAPRVLVASGYISEPADEAGDSLAAPLMTDILELANFVGQHPFWKAQIGQVYVNPEKEIELIPRVGDHRVLIGDAQNLETKLENLLIFYRKAMPRVGWDTYKMINLKYEDQIVATKKNVELKK